MRWYSLISLRVVQSFSRTRSARKSRSGDHSFSQLALESRELLSAQGLQSSSAVYQDKFAPGAVIERTKTQAPADNLRQSPANIGTQLNGNGLEFNFIPAAGMPQQAIDGFQAAANLWRSILRDDIRVNINIDFRPLGSGILGQAGSTTQTNTYAQYRTALQNDATSGDDVIAVTNLPTGPNLSLYSSAVSGTPVVDNNNSANNQSLNINTALAKALGLRTAGNTTSDASIAFSSSFTWDFNRADGITAGAYDFVGVAAHEIGHALGFTSGADYVDFYTGAGPGRGAVEIDQQVFVEPLDLFRRSTASESNNTDIDIRADLATKFFSIDGGTTNLTTFSTGSYNGDGRQASHWKDDLGIGIMDPTGAPGELLQISNFDRQAFDVIGWNVTLPGPEIGVFDGTTSIADNTGTVSIGATSLGGSPATKTLTVRNTGTANLVLQPATITGNGFSLASNFTAGQVVAPGQSTSIIVQLDSATTGFKSATISFANNDSDENPYNFTITGTVSASSSAEIDVLAGTTDLTSNVGSVNFGEIPVGSPAVTRQFFIRNSGNSTLILQPATLTGGGFALTQNVMARQTVAPGGSATISVRMDANLIGAKTGVLTIISNDADEGSFKVNLVGNVQSAALGSITGKVFGDTDGNGALNGGESGIANRTVYMDLNGNGVQDQAGVVTATYPATGLPQAINDLSTIVAPLSITTANGTISDINVQVNITHPFAPDIEMTLIAPNGQRVALAFDRGGNGSNFTNTIFDDQAATPVSAGAAPFTGSFRPEQPLNVLNGINPNGTWGLEVTDDFAGDSGTLLGWSLNITTSGAAEPFAVTNATGDYTFAGLAAGPYQIRQVLPANWVQTGPANGQPHNITLAPGQNVAGNDFGSRLSTPANNVIILDDGDAGFSVSGNWATVTSGYGNDRRLANAGNANATASWNFTGLQSGQYRIAATWIGAANRASNIPYTVRSTAGSPILLNTTIDQRPNPASFVDSSTNWQTLGTVTIFGNSLLVTATNTTTGLITADAIRLERLGNAIDLVDDGDAGFSTTGNWSSATTGFGNDRRLAAAGSGTAIATWSFSNLAAGQYRISATWNNPATNRANDAPYSIRETESGPSLLTTAVNQRLAPSGFSEGGVLWQDLGTVVISGDSLVIRLSNSTTGLVTADAIRIERIS